MKTYEIWKMIDENYKEMKGKKYKLIKAFSSVKGIELNDIARVGRTIDEMYGLFNENKFMIRGLTGFEEWQEVKEPVSFMEVIENVKKNNTMVKVEHELYTSDFMMLTGLLDEI